MGDDDMLNLNWNNFGDNFSGLVKEFRDDKRKKELSMSHGDDSWITVPRTWAQCGQLDFLTVNTLSIKARETVTIT